MRTLTLHRLGSATELELVCDEVADLGKESSERNNPQYPTQWSSHSRIIPTDRPVLRSRISAP
jgi:hypothetical protein